MIYMGVKPMDLNINLILYVCAGSLTIVAVSNLRSLPELFGVFLCKHNRLKKRYSVGRFMPVS